MSVLVPRIAAGSGSSGIITSLSCTNNVVARSLSSVMVSSRLNSPRENEPAILAFIPTNCRTRNVYAPIHALQASYYSSSPLSLSSSSPDSNENKKEFAKITRLEDANPERIHGIKVNPDSLGYGVLPGNLIYKTYKWSGNTRKVPLELAHGYFWMVWDLKKTDQKPTLTSDGLIPAKEAQHFPPLEGLTTLDDLNTELDLPLHFLEHAQAAKKKNRQQQKVAGKITLVAITFRDNGFKMMPTWTEPFEQAFAKDSSSSNSSRGGDSSRVQTFTVSITERWALYPIRNTVKRVMKKNTPEDMHSNTLAYFGTKEVMDFRDILRMHNIMTSYVFLLDDMGRVRFAGSGEASKDEVATLVRCAKELLRESDAFRKKPTKKHR
mmetsp:Transcript_3938/g.8538  ORF Transcript_3938/g.8538 Transcript_3938/m.8538 type:complete len:380 (+) Transcript_3938:97-1236(+)